MNGSLGAYRASMADLSNLHPSTAKLVEQLRAAGIAPNLEIISGYRDPARNAAAGGAKGSQHILGRAIDISTNGLTDDQRASILKTAIANGATGIGIYPGGSLHFDTRESGPAFWGTGGSYRGQPVSSAPQWAQGSLATLFGQPAPAADSAVAASTPPTVVVRSTRPPQVAPESAAPNAPGATPAGPVVTAPTGPASSDKGFDQLLAASLVQQATTAPFQQMAQAEQQAQQERQQRRRALLGGGGLASLFG